jgi:hypothetical protein
MPLPSSSRDMRTKEPCSSRLPVKPWISTITGQRVPDGPSGMCTVDRKVSLL